MIEGFVFFVSVFFSSFFTLPLAVATNLYAIYSRTVESKADHHGLIIIDSAEKMLVTLHACYIIRTITQV